MFLPVLFTQSFFLPCTFAASSTMDNSTSALRGKSHPFKRTHPPHHLTRLQGGNLPLSRLVGGGRVQPLDFLSNLCTLVKLFRLLSGWGSRPRKWYTNEGMAESDANGGWLKVTERARRENCVQAFAAIGGRASPLCLSICWHFVDLLLFAAVRRVRA